MYNFSAFHRYPESYSKNQKRSLRRKSKDHFKIENGNHFYSAAAEKKVGCTERIWRRVIRKCTDEERSGILSSCHCLLEGLLYIIIYTLYQHQNNWDLLLDGVLFAYRTAVHKSTGLYNSIRNYILQVMWHEITYMYIC